MTKDIVMIHGANEGAWCFDRFKALFESVGFNSRAPDLVGHGTKAVAGGKNLVGVGMADYRAELEAFLATVPPRPVLLGHSMGGVLAQQLAVQGLAHALVLVAPAPRCIVHIDWAILVARSLSKIPSAVAASQWGTRW